MQPPAGYGNFLVDPASGLSLRIPSRYSSLFGLPQAQQSPPSSFPPPEQIAPETTPVSPGAIGTIGGIPAIAPPVESPPPVASTPAPSPAAQPTPATGPTPTTPQVPPTAVPQPAPQQSAAPLPQQSAPSPPAQAADAEPPIALTPIESAPATFEGSEQLSREGMALGERANAMATQAQAQAAQDKADALTESIRRQQGLLAEQEKARAERAKREQELQAEYDRATDEWANYKIDPGRRWKNASTGSKIAAIMAVAMTALGDALQRKSGPNAAIEMIHNAIRDDVQLQMDERAQLKERALAKRNSIDDYIKQTGRQEDAFALKMSEELKRSAQEMERRAALSSIPEIKARGLATAGEMRKLAGQYIGTVADARLKREEDAKRLALDQQRVAQGWAGLKEQRRQFDERMNLERLQLGMEAEKLARAGQEKMAERVLQQGVAAPPRAVRAPDGSLVLDRNTGALKNADGTPWIIPTVDEAKEFRKKKAAADSIVSILDEIRAIRDRVGGETSWGNSDDYQRLKVLKENLVLLKKAGTQGMSSDADMARIEAALGADSPASFRAQAAKLEKGRDQVIKQLDADARNLGYTGDPITYPDPLAHKATASAGDEIWGNVLIGQGTGYEGGKQLRDRILSDLVSRATGGDAEALRKLEEGARIGKTPAVRNAFTGALTSVRARLGITQPTPKKEIRYE